MTKKKNVFLLLLVSLISSCEHVSTSTTLNDSSNNSSSNTTSSNSSNSSLNSSTSTQLESNLQNVWDCLMLLPEGNFSFEFNQNGKVQEDIYNENYVWLGNYNSGYALLESYLKDGNKVVYQLSKENEEIVINDVVIMNSSPLYDLTSFNPTSDINNLSEDYFEEDENKVVSTNINVVSIFASLISLDGYVSEGYIDEINFYFNANNQLVFELIQPSTVSSDNTLSRNQRTALFKKVGSSKDEKIENVMKGFSIPNETITSDALSYLFNSSFESNTTMTTYVDGNVDSVDKGSLLFNDTDIQVITDFSGVYLSTHYKKKDDGSIVYQYINPNNELVEETQQGSWSNITFPSTVINPSEFFKTGDNIYHYYGFKAAEIASSLTFIKEASDVSSIDFKVIDNKVTEIEMKTPIGNDSITGAKVQYVFNVAVATNPSQPKEVSSYSSSSDTLTLQTAFDELIKEGANYKARSYISELNLTYVETIVTENVILKKSVVVTNEDDGTHNEILWDYYGYYLKNDGTVISFDIDKNDKVTLNNLREKDETNFASNGLFNVNANLFEFTDSNKASFIIHNDVRRMDEVITGGFYSNLLSDGTIKGTLKDGKLETLSYKYQITTNASLTDEKITFDWSTQTISSSLLTKIQALEDTSSISWMDVTESYDIPYTYLTQLYGTEDLVKQIPYLSDERINKVWSLEEREGGSNSGGIFVYTSLTFKPYPDDTSFSFNEYLTNYGALLETNGFTKNNNVYTLDNFKITLDSTKGIKFEKNS